MKLLNVFGLVVGAHLAVFTVIFATPGCRSTGKQKPKPEDTLAAGDSAPVSPVDSFAPAPATMNDADINPAGASASSVSPVAPVAPAADPSGFGIRFTPTRPTAAPVAAEPAPAAAKATHTVAKGDSLWAIARKYGISVDELAAANQLAKSATLRLGQQLTVPAKAAPVGAPVESDAANTYEVKSGDTLGAIARRHGTTASALRTANNLSGDNLRIGQKLVIPGNATPLSPSASTPRAAAPSAPRAGAGTYTVSPGDTLGSIARKHGVKVGDIATLNTITDPAKLRVGQVLKLPAGAKVRAAASAPAASPAAPAPAPAPVPVEPAPTPVEPAAPSTVTPVEPPSSVEPMTVPVIRID